MKDSTIDPTPLSVFRFLGVIIVNLIHYSTNTGNFSSIISSYATGDSIIEFFYILSGFGLFLSYNKQGGINLRRYFIKRTIRILPFYYMALLMMAIILLISSHFSFTGFFLSLFCIQTWIPHYQHTMNSPAWFVANLMFFYCIFPLIFFRIKKETPDPGKLLFSSILLWVSTLIVLNSLVSVSTATSEYIESFPLAHFCSFYMGICGAYFIIANKTKNHSASNFKSAWYTLFLFLLYCSFILIIYYQAELAVYIKIKLPSGVGSGGGMILLTPIMLLMIINLSTAQNYLTKILSLRFFMLLGAISYPLYIFQTPIYGIYDHFIAKPMKIQPGADFILFLMLFILFASVLTYIENHLLKRVLRRI